MADDFDVEAEATGLKRTDFPSPHHPLLENNAEVRELSDLIDARRNPANLDGMVRENEGDRDASLDVENALTLPHKRRRTTSADRADRASDFDADARTHTPPDDEDDASYMTRADFVSSMEMSDPDPNEGMGDGEYIEGEGLDIDRAVDITGTVTGVDRGMGTHLPLDLGAGGFQIVEPEDVGDPRAEELPEYGPDGDDDLEDEYDPDALTIPGASDRPKIRTRDEALDATRQLE
jgi:hypothetical protein